MKLQVTRSSCVLILLLAAMGAGIGCSTMQSVSPKVADHQLSAKVQRSLKRNAVYKFSGINVTASNSTVQLSGFTSSEKEKQKAEELAKRVNGVNEVINKIVVQ